MYSGPVEGHVRAAVRELMCCVSTAEISIHDILHPGSRPEPKNLTHLRATHRSGHSPHLSLHFIRFFLLGINIAVMQKCTRLG